MESKQPDFNSSIIKDYEEIFKNKFNISFEPRFYTSQKYTTKLLVGYREGEYDLFHILYGESKATKSFKWRIYSKNNRLTSEEKAYLKSFITDLNKGPLTVKEFKAFEDLIKSLSGIKENLYLYNREETLALLEGALKKFKLSK